MEKRMLIAVCVAIGVVAGGFTGMGVFYAFKPAPSPAPITYTLTIIDYKSDASGYYLNWTPSSVGSNYTDGTGKQCVSIVFEENTKVLLIAHGWPFNPLSSWPSNTSVVWITYQQVWIMMDSSKTIQPSWD